MLKSEAGVHALAWLSAGQLMLPPKDMDREVAQLHHALATLAYKVGQCYAAISDGNHPVNGTALDRVDEKVLHQP